MKIRKIFIYLHRFFFLGHNTNVVTWAASSRKVIPPPFIIKDEEVAHTFKNY